MHTQNAYRSSDQNVGEGTDRAARAVKTPVVGSGEAGKGPFMFFFFFVFCLFIFCLFLSQDLTM